MINPLKIGNKTFPNNLIQGPLAGISCPSLRLLTWQYSKPAFSYSEMISATALAKNYKHGYEHLVKKDPKEGPVCFQLFGKIPEELATAAKILTDLGADLIDLNCGCSVPKVRGNGAGSALLMDRTKLYTILIALRKSTALPLIAKIRVANDETINHEIAKVAEDAGIDCLVVHGRNWEERYNTPCRYDAIKYFVTNVKIPVIGNGDITDISSLKKMFATGCAGAMIARAGVGQPWLIGKLIAEANDQIFTPPAPQEIGKIFIFHIEHMAHYLKSERTAVLRARKLAKSYARCLKHKKEFCNSINQCETLADFKALCTNYFTNS